MISRFFARRPVFLSCLAACLGAVTGAGRARAQEEAAPPSGFVPGPAVVTKAGTRSITIPAPAGMENCVGVWPKYDELTASFLPPINRMLAHFLPPEDVALLREEKASESGIDFNAQITKSLENQEIGTATFASLKSEVIASLDKAAGTLADDMKKLEREGNKRVEKIAGKDLAVSLGKPVPLGRFLESDSAVGFSMLLTAGAGEEAPSVSVVSCIMSPVNGRMINLYATFPYEGDADKAKSEAAVSAWHSAVVAANPRLAGRPAGLKGLLHGVGGSAFLGGVIGGAVALVLLLRKRLAKRKSS